MAYKSLFHRKKSKVGYYCFWILNKLNLIKYADILLKVQKNAESVDSKVLKLKLVNQCYYKNVLYLVVKSQDL